MVEYPFLSLSGRSGSLTIISLLRTIFLTRSFSHTLTSSDSLTIISLLRTIFLTRSFSHTLTSSDSLSLELVVAKNQSKRLLPLGVYYLNMTTPLPLPFLWCAGVREPMRNCYNRMRELVVCVCVSLSLSLSLTRTLSLTLSHSLSPSLSLSLC